MDGKHIAESELIFNADGSIFSSASKAGNILQTRSFRQGDPERVSLVASHFSMRLKQKLRTENFTPLQEHIMVKGLWFCPQESVAIILI